MPEIIKEPIKIRNDDYVLYNLKLKLVSEKINERNQEILMFFFKYYITMRILIYSL